jgi:hypothetical protein
MVFILLILMAVIGQEASLTNGSFVEGNFAV